MGVRALLSPHQPLKTPGHAKKQTGGGGDGHIVCGELRTVYRFADKPFRRTVCLYRCLCILSVGSAADLRCCSLVPSFVGHHMRQSRNNVVETKDEVVHVCGSRLRTPKTTCLLQPAVAADVIHRGYSRGGII